MGQTRSPATPAAPSNLDSLFAAGQNDPGTPTLSPGDGLRLGGIFSITVSLWPNPGLTITGGSMLAWIYSVFQSNWSRAPDLDLNITTTVTGPVGYTFQPQRVLGRGGYLLNYLSSSVTGTSTDFLLRIDGFTSVLGQSA